MINPITSMTASPPPARALYGIDAPGVVRGMFVIGISMIAVGIIAAAIIPRERLAWLLFVAAAVLLAGASFICTGAVMLWGSLIGKLRVRDRVLDAVAWRGDEVVLDVGCGHGLMLIGAARRVPRGRAVGIDLWRDVDQAANSADATVANARAEGVADRVDVVGGDMRALPFEAATFDVVVSSWAIHNIDDASERARALDEIVRVLKPGGRLAIVDIQRSAEYAAHLERAGLRDVRRSGRNHVFVIPSWTVSAVKPVFEC